MQPADALEEYTDSYSVAYGLNMKKKKVPQLCFDKRFTVIKYGETFVFHVSS